MSLVEYLNKQSQQFLMSLGIFLIFIVGLLDYIIGLEIGLSIFYLPSIFLTTWFIGTWGGILTSFIGAITWLIVDLVKTKPNSFSFSLYWNACVRLGFFLVIVLLQKALRNEQLLARIDSLTQIGNRRFFFESADNEIHKAKRYNRPFSLAYMDIDDFKNVNDLFGHNMGDKFLRVVANTIKNNIRSTDIFARIGGDEFVLFFPETKAEEAREAINKLQQLLLRAMNENEYRVTFSIGIITFISPPDSADDMMEKVDRLMYSAKNAGKNLIKYESF